VSNKYLIVVAGPTAVGKTELCLKLAAELHTHIISADSRQFFRELSIGTAKPTTSELQRVPHHFINSHTIAEPYSAGDYERDVLALLSQLFLERDCVIVTGGSGLYIKAICEGLSDLPQPAPGLRDELMRRLREEGLEALQSEVLHVDPAFSATAEFLNPQRVIRALEVYYTGGRPLSSYHTSDKAERPFQPLLIALGRDREVLYERIEVRVDQMLETGLVEEARGVIRYRNHHALQTVGYREVYGYLDGLYDYQEMVRLLKQNSRRYAKRQNTWFRHQGKYTWFEADAYEDIRNWIISQMDQRNSHI
jgi:tRNA dimethylallyltransferase